jgi:hypothetical protein
MATNITFFYYSLYATCSKITKTATTITLTLVVLYDKTACNNTMSNTVQTAHSLKAVCRLAEGEKGKRAQHL